jgi:hypothetical protein
MPVGMALPLGEAPVHECTIGCGWTMGDSWSVGKVCRRPPLKANIDCNVMNRMTNLGMPVSVRIKYVEQLTAECNCRDIHAPTPPAPASTVYGHCRGSPSHR